MIVVSDTSPVSALVTVGELDILFQLFGEVIIPPAVHLELRRSHPVLPTWLRVEKVKDVAKAAALGIEVDAGEADAIALARELHADRLLIDDNKGRRLAEREGVPVIGLLGVILLAKTKGLIPFARPLLTRLKNEAHIYLAKGIIEAALKSVGE